MRRWGSLLKRPIARRVGKDGICHGKQHQLKTVAKQLQKEGAFRRCTWRQGSRRAMSAGFARILVQVGDTETATLLIEWRDYEIEPANYYLVSMAKVPAVSPPASFGPTSTGITGDHGATRWPQHGSSPEPTACRVRAGPIRSQGGGGRLVSSPVEVGCWVAG